MQEKLSKHKHPFISIPEVHISKSTLQGFRKRAWRVFPLEYLEYFLGFREGSNIYIITSLYVEQTATKDQVQVEEEVIESLYNENLGRKLKVIGSIHTHPVTRKDPQWLQEVNSHLSRHDHKEGALSGELISAVMVPWISKEGRKRSRVVFWLPQARIQPIST